MLAQRFAGLLPAMSVDEALDVRSHRQHPRPRGRGARTRGTTAGQAQPALQGAEIERHAALDAAALKFMHGTAARLGWSARSTHRALKVARTIADLAGDGEVQTAHVAEAMQYRRALHAAE